ncbi:right-handed parallel beta-helix repeat-containing protein, partial [Aliifodinibius sp. S!AR15-10]|uniref:right-handed parallel beta-helix repeat-containing protein n=1 Tax=Aliifodinibius sp. S!AR15-10 TaxID=2950437 RepID=UPI00285A6F4B
MKISMRSFWILIVSLFMSSAVIAQTTVSSDITTNTTWGIADSPVTVSTTVTVAEGATLTIEPGVTVQMDSGVSLLVEGALVADGTATDNILFTSSTGTPAAGDWQTIRFSNTSNVGSVIDFVVFEYGGSGSGGSLVSYTTGAFGFDITNSEFRFSNAHGIDLRASSPLIQNSTFRDNGGFGIFSDLALNYQVETSTIVRNAQGGIRVPINATPIITESVIDTNSTGILIDNGAIPEITDNDIRANETGIRVVETGSTTPVISDNNISGNTTIGVLNEGMGLLVADYNFWGDKNGPQNSSNPNGTGDIVSNNVDYSPWLFGDVLPVREITANPANGDTWYADSVYYVRQNITLGQLSTLTIEPGAVIKFDNDVTFSVMGTLVADGTPTDRIYFTSNYDDAIGGDSNGDGRTTQPQPGDWRRMLIENESANVVLDYVDLRYGGYSNSTLFLDDNTASVSNLVVLNSYSHGIYINLKPATFRNVVSNNNRLTGIYINNQGSELKNIAAKYNGYSGIEIYLNNISENISIYDSEFTNNERNGVHFSSGGADRSFGLDTLVNTTFSGNIENGLLLEENGASELYVNNNTFEANGHYGASIFLNTAFGASNHIEANTFKDNGYAGLRTTSARIFNNQFQGNEFGITLWGQLGHTYTDGSGTDGNTFTGNTFNNVLGLEGNTLQGTLSTTFPEAITSGAYMFLQSGS